ncbi:hypothetical protein LJR290_006191 [Variovorax sp. LjRoot290]|uniref:hypothetical protein n=1 Tax=Variovorax sp. LjRoot290 TaxID=3342316 RepID=UPI003ECEBDD1
MLRVLAALLDVLPARMEGDEAQVASQVVAEHRCEAREHGHTGFIVLRRASRDRRTFGRSTLLGLCVGRCRMVALGMLSLCPEVSRESVAGETASGSWSGTGARGRIPTCRWRASRRPGRGELRVEDRSVDHVDEAV